MPLLNALLAPSALSPCSLRETKPGGLFYGYDGEAYLRGILIGGSDEKGFPFSIQLDRWIAAELKAFDDEGENGVAFLDFNFLVDPESAYRYESENVVPGSLIAGGSLIGIVGQTRDAKGKATVIVRPTTQEVKHLVAYHAWKIVSGAGQVLYEHPAE